MSKTRPHRRRPRAAARPLDARPFAILWHLAWALVVAGAATALTAGGWLIPGPELAALTLMAVPSGLGALMSASRERGAGAVVVVIWALAATVACQLTGGALGPLAPWALAPLAAAAAFRRPDLLPLGAAASVAAAALGTLGAILMPMPGALGAAAWLSLLSLATVALGLAAPLVSMAGVARAEARQRDREELRLLEILENQPQWLLGLYPGGRILESFGQRPVGFEEGDLLDRNILDFVAPDHRAAVEDALQRAVANGSAEIGFALARDPDGWCELALRRMSSIRIAGALHDGRAQKIRERDLEQARASAEQQNAGKSRFLANMSHELRTPLNAIMGFSDIMRQRLFGPMPDRYVEYAELIHESGAHLLELINDVLDMSKIEAERYELARDDFDARDAVSAVLRLMRGQADRAGVSLRGILPSEVLEADADRRAIKQIALNLISNALKFTPKGGAVTVTLQGSGEVLELIVADSGVGIAPADLERLGRPFEQAGDATQKAGGAGLGLSLVRAFAKLHGGDMTIESALGEGTTVVVRMPVLKAAQTEPSAPPTPPAPANDERLGATL